MNPDNREERRFLRRARQSDMKSGDISQHDAQIAIAHTGSGDIVVSVGGGSSIVGESALLSGGQALGPTAVIRTTLPDDARGFTGRDRAIQFLVRAIVPEVGTGRAAAIHAVDGMAGVGKTALAVHVAHRLASRFPDGRWFMRMHAHTAGHQVVQPGTALTALLSVTGLHPAEIPDGLEEKEDKWQEWVSSRRILVLLDDAMDYAQIRHLLPQAGGSAALVTSRRRIETLESLELDVMSAEDALKLFSRLSGRGVREPGATRDLVVLAGRLPLAIGMLAGRLRHRRVWSVADMVEELATARNRSAVIRAADEQVSAAFDLCYNHLPPGRRAFFRSLGMHPGTDIDGYAAAALTALSLDETRRELDELYADHLIEEPSRGRYRFHDLLRDYARALAASVPAEDQDKAVQRLFGYYAHIAITANGHLARHPPMLDASSFSLPRYAPEISTRAQASAWMEAELANLQALTEPSYVSIIAAAMADFLLTAGSWEQADSLHLRALNNSCSRQDLLGQAIALTNLGRVHSRLKHEYELATDKHTQALKIFRALGNPHGQADSLCDLGSAKRLAGQYDAAIALLTQALQLYLAHGNKLGQAIALTNLSHSEVEKGEYAKAVANLTQALELSRAIQNQVAEANALSALGNARCSMNEYTEAVDRYSQALELFHRLGDRLSEVRVLNGLGLAQYWSDDTDAALASYYRGLELSRVLGDRAWEAGGLWNVGSVQSDMGDYPGALANYTQALDIYRALGAHLEEAVLLADVGSVQCQTGNYAEAYMSLIQALELCHVLGDQSDEAYVPLKMGTLQRLTAKCKEAVIGLTRASHIWEDLGGSHDEAHAFCELGASHCALGDYAMALSRLTQALTMARSLRDRTDEAECLNNTGEAMLASSGEARRQEHHERALAIAREIGFGLPLVAWTLRLKGPGDGTDTQEVRSGFPEGRGATGPEDRQAGGAGAARSEDQR